MSTEAAAFHGLATNGAYPLDERLHCALKALALYEAETERRDAVVEAARDWRDMRLETPGRPKPESAALIAAVDALDGAS